MSVELECAGMKGGLESGDKLAAEDTAEHFDGKEERAAGGIPAGVIWSEAASGKHAVDMGMMLQSLIPGRSTLKKPISLQGAEDRGRSAAGFRRWRETAGCRSDACSAMRVERVPAGV
jgi:hypothetical protein